MRKIIRRNIFLFFIGIISILLIGCEYESNERNINEIVNEKGKSSTEHKVKVIYINAGKADSTLIMIDNKSYLIDTGEKSSATNIKSVLDSNGITRLDGVFLTHTHSDHIGGLKKVKKAIQIDKVYSSNISWTKGDGTNDIDEKVSGLGLSHNKLDAGDIVNVVDDVNFIVLGPLEYNEQDDNDNSLVLRLNVNGKTLLFTGDMQLAEETTLINKGIDLDADILKVGNHGNKDATSQEFADAVSPEIAIISTDTTQDKNSANKKVIKRLGDTKIYITEDYSAGVAIKIDKDGKVTVEE